MPKHVNDDPIKNYTIAELRAMTPEELALVPGKIKRKMHLNPAKKGEKRNKHGKNDGVDRFLIKRTLALKKVENRLETTNDLSELIPDCIATLHDIILHSKSDSAKIRAVETVFAFTMEAKSTVKHDHRVSGGTVNAIVYLPADTPISMTDVLEVNELDSLPGSNDKTNPTE